MAFSPRVPSLSGCEYSSSWFFLFFFIKRVNHTVDATNNPSENTTFVFCEFTSLPDGIFIFLE